MKNAQQVARRCHPPSAPASCMPRSTNGSQQCLPRTAASVPGHASSRTPTPARAMRPRRSEARPRRPALPFPPSAGGARRLRKALFSCLSCLFHAVQAKRSRQQEKVSSKKGEKVGRWCMPSFPCPPVGNRRRECHGRRVTHRKHHSKELPARARRRRCRRPPEGVHRAL